jgi:hypothetical protein
MWFAADSDCLDAALYQRVRTACGPVDALFVGTESVGGPLSWINGVLFPSPPTKPHHETRRYHGCSARTALVFADAVGAGQIYIYALGIEPWVETWLGLGMNESAPQWLESERLLAALRARGCDARRLEGPCDLIIESSTRPTAVAVAATTIGDVEVADFQF